MVAARPRVSHIRGLATTGPKGIAALVDRCSRHAHSLVTRIGQLPGAEVLWESEINQGLVRFLDSSLAPRSGSRPTY